MNSNLSSRRGSVLIVAMLLAGIIGISLVSYLKLANNALKQADRSFYANSAMNVSEIGLEEAISTFNQIDDVGATAAFTSWGKPGGNAATNTFPSTSSSYPVGPNSTAPVKVYTSDYTGTSAAPVIVAKSIVSPPSGNGPTLIKYIEVTLRKRSLFANGLVARNNVSWTGHPMADSWNSDPTGTGTPVVAYSTSVRTANIVVGSLTGSIGLGSGGEVWGYAKTGPSGTISGGSVHDLSSSTNDPTRRTNDFNSTFPTVTVPTTTGNVISGSSSSITATTVFPRLGDSSVVVNGVTTYYYTFTGANIDLSGGRTLTVTAPCVFVLNSHANVPAITTGGSASINIATGATLNVYTNGNVSIGGNGLINANTRPKDCIIWGTATTSQTIDISGNGQLKALVYAPNAALGLNGGGSSGSVMGAAVAGSITMNGGTEFHYDDSLGNMTTGNPYGISKWRELQSSADRQPYDDEFATF